MAYIEAEIMGVNAWWIGLTDQGHEGRSVEILLVMSCFEFFCYDGD